MPLRLPPFRMSHLFQDSAQHGAIAAIANPNSFDDNRKDVKIDIDEF
jgi:hypothetical protein